MRCWIRIMNSLFLEYINNLYKDVPSWVYEGLVSILCLGSILLLAFCDHKKCNRFIMSLLFVEYVILIYCSTVFFRLSNESQGYEFNPFWSYTAIKEGRIELIPENVMNVVVFVLVGVLFCAVFRSIKWWQVLSLGCLISLSIETMQFVLKRGFAETDDVIHNTLGCMIGFCLYRFVAVFKILRKSVKT